MSATEGLSFGWGRKLPMVLQTEAAECGLACVSMLAGYFGYPVDIAALRRRFGLSLKGATLKDLIGIADQIGLASRPLRLELDEIGMLRTPCVLHWDLGHFVVLKSVGRGNAIIHDPSFGIRRLSFEQLSQHFTGIALELSPTGRFQAAEAPPRIRIRALLGDLVGLRRSLGQLLALALANEVFAMVSPLFLVWVVDQALVTADRDLLLTLVLGFSLLQIIQTAITAMRGWVLMVLGASMKVQARSNLFSHLLNLPASYFESRYIGDVMSRFGSQETLLQAITTELVVAILDGLMCCVTLSLMFVFAPSLTLVFASSPTHGCGRRRWRRLSGLRGATAIFWRPFEASEP
jgi:ATP-binding cassette, subfamily B, bacterial CvaB/MchF/RaxB